MQNKINLRFVFGAGLVVTLLVFTLSHDSSYVRQKYFQKIPTFLEIANATGTDKVSYHKYECMYADALAPYRHIPNIKILEIGLGCTMGYGPGASYHLWAKYFDDAQIYFLEYDKTCGEKWAKSLQSTINEQNYGKKVKLPIMSYGDQTDSVLLQKMAAEHGPWDLIVDDGGHSMSNQIESFKYLFPAVKPGGVYFLEDLVTSLWAQYGGTTTGLNTPERNTTISFVAQVLANSISVDDVWTRRVDIGSSMDRLECCDQICAFRAKRV